MSTSYKVRAIEGVERLKKFFGKKRKPILGCRNIIKNKQKSPYADIPQ